MLNRLVFLFSLIGMILAIHLWIQKERDFDQGCWGFGESAEAAATSPSGCRSAELEKISKFFGVSIAAWGYMFYFFVAAMAFAQLVLSARVARVCYAASEIGVALAFPYTCYLLYYQVAAKAFCPLCIVSALLVASLFTIHVIKYRRGGFVAVSADQRAHEIGYSTGMSFVAVSALVAILLFVNHLGTRGFDEGSNAEKFTSMVGRSLPRYIEAAKLQEMKPVGFNFNIPSLRMEDWIASSTPSLGTPGKIKVAAFLDPNCPSCKGEFTMLESLAKRYHGQASFYVFSRVLWGYSLLQSQALEIARDTGKYFDLWRVQLDRQRQGGLDLPAIKKIFMDLNLDTADLDQRLAAALPVVKAQRDRAIAAGINGTPTIFIDGLAVDDLSRDERSLGKLIERAEQARTTARK